MNMATKKAGAREAAAGEGEPVELDDVRQVPYPLTETPFMHALNGSDAGTLRRLVDFVFLPHSCADPQEQVFAIDLLAGGLADAPADVRLEITRRLALLQNKGGHLIARLARGADLDVAGLLLSQSSAVTDHDLAEIAQEAGPEICEIVASRDHLSSTVTAALAQAGHEQALRLALDNRNAHFSAATLSAIVAHAGDCPNLHAGLVRRAEISPAQALELFWHLDPGLRSNVLLRFVGDGRTLSQLLVADMEDMARFGGRAGDAGTQTGNGNGKKKTKPRKPLTMQEGIAALGDALERGWYNPASLALVDLITISEELASMIVRDPLGEPLAVALKAAGVSRKQFSGLIARCTEAKKGPIADARGSDALMALFEKMSRGQARIAMIYWGWQVDAGSAASANTSAKSARKAARKAA